MKRTMKNLITIIMTLAMIFAVTISASAKTAFEFDENPNCIWSQSITEGEVYSGFTDRIYNGYEYYSNNEDVLVVKEDGTVYAKSEGSAVIAELHDGELTYYYAFTVSPKASYDDYDSTLSVYDDDWDDDWDDDEEEEEEFDIMMIIGPALIVLLVGLLLAEIFYIFVTAPKFGMSRFWALAPIVGNVFGLIVFLMLKTAAKQNNQVSKNVIDCPTCNGKHPYGTEVCSICGTKLGN